MVASVDEASESQPRAGMTFTSEVYEAIDDLLVSPQAGLEWKQAVMGPIGHNRVAGQDS
jgi:hypothetical protein